MIRALVTGAGGFVGKYLVRHLALSGRLVYAAGRSRPQFPPEIAQPVALDVTDPRSVVAALLTTLPDEIYHLAAVAQPVGQAPGDYVRTNVEGTLNLLVAVAAHVPQGRLLVVTSGLAYGECEDGPVVETAPLRPRGLYAASKAAADLLAGAVGSVMPGVIRARPFNHSGPGQSANYLLGAITRQAAEFRMGRREPIMELGNLHARRDFSDVRDVVAAYLVLMETGQPGEAYNVCSGRTVSVSELADLTMKVCGLSFEIRSVFRQRRVEDIVVAAGNNERLRALGWTPQFSLEGTILDTVTDWEERLGGI